MIVIGIATTKQGVTDLNDFIGKRVNGKRQRQCRHPIWAVFVCKETYAGVDEEGYDVYVNTLQCEDCDEILGPESDYDVAVQRVDRTIAETPVLLIGNLPAVN